MMGTNVKKVARKIIERAGFVVHRAPANRFDSTATARRQVSHNGYRPRVVIDCGANRAQWFGIARGFALFDLASLSSRLRDQRLWLGDAIVIRRGSPLVEDVCRE